MFAYLHCGRSVVTCLITTIFLVLLSQSSALAETFAKPVQLSEEQRMRLALAALEKALNEPSPFTFDLLAPAIPDDQREQARALLEPM